MFKYLGMITKTKYRQGYEKDGKAIVLELVRDGEFWKFSQVIIQSGLEDSEELEIMLESIVDWATRRNYNILSKVEFGFGGKDTNLVYKLEKFGVDYTKGHVYFGDEAFQALRFIKNYL